MGQLNETKVNRNAYEVGSLDENNVERDYWRTKSPVERMAALELTRQIVYGYDPATTRLSGFFEVVEQ